jgi:hypothetical protein
MIDTALLHAQQDAAPLERPIRRAETMRNRHPCDTPYKRTPLARIVILAVREALYRPHRPDSSRQYAACQRARQLRQARRLKLWRSTNAATMGD